MSDILIKVRGSHSVEVAPERGVVSAEVVFDGSSPEPVMERVQRGLHGVRAELERLERDGAIERFVVQRVRTSAERPWSQDGKQLPLVHRASVGLTAEFVDFTALSAWVGRTAADDGLQVHHIEWRLTKDSRLKVERDVRQEAVRQAKVRAQDYADALDLGPVAVRSINDVGVSHEVAYASAAMEMAAAPKMHRGSTAPDLAFDPDDITVNAEVEAAFTVTS
ncbi:SIMPL domain-containing protein [Nocardioides sp. KC13]|uniref:SIMPL domain-containing protein n=1 Tax=Nocardioides turkmenicus TaxID=2711220 RepID=A0A6M1R0W9_9ACTN|nr:SIMPL domain-containing protein [Nocardioides sp. KC13]NGN92291.1 SIMPL domain-containing protein [Nocardioides sp. KC13]